MSLSLLITLLLGVPVTVLAILQTAEILQKWRGNKNIPTKHIGHVPKSNAVRNGQRLNALPGERSTENELDVVTAQVNGEPHIIQVQGNSEQLVNQTQFTGERRID